MGYKPLALMAAVAVFGSANASINVWLDYAGFDSTVVTAWTNGGYSGANALTAGEILGIKNDVQTKLETIYNGFDVTFNQSNPGGVFETLRLGATTTSSGLYGEADRIDWRNKIKTDSAEIYAHNFANIIMTGSFNRAQNLERLKNALAGTTAHEFGHNLGLQHYDPFGVDSIRAPGYTGVTGQQNNQIMATGGTGLSALQRGTMRAFGPVELVKLQYAEGMTSTPGKVEAEAAGAKNSLASAQAITGAILPITNHSAVVVEGRIQASQEVDIYKFQADAGSLIYANTQSTYLNAPAGGTVNTIISLLDSNGTVLTTNDNIRYSTTAFMTTGATYGNDSLIQNFVAQYSGTYYLSVQGSGTDTGSYDLLMTGLNPVPEPATMAALGAGVLWMARRRRSKKA